MSPTLTDTSVPSTSTDQVDALIGMPVSVSTRALDAEPVMVPALPGRVTVAAATIGVPLIDTMTIVLPAGVTVVTKSASPSI